MELHEVRERLRERVVADETFRAELRTDPEGVLRRETGMSAAEFVGLAEQQLSDDELSNVSGGFPGGVKCDYCGAPYAWHELGAALLHWASCPDR